MFYYRLAYGLLFAHLIAIGAAGTECYYCANVGKELDPNLRRKLGNQRDIFYWPLDAANSQCHIHSSVNALPKGQICTQSNCVVITPNVPDVNFTIRGCADQILRYPLKTDSRLNKTACFLVKAKPIYFDEESLSYLMCLCQNSWCNDHSQPSFLPIKIADDVMDSKNDVIELVEVRRGERLAKDAGGKVGAIYEVTGPENSAPTRALDFAAIITVVGYFFWRG